MNSAEYIEVTIRIEPFSEEAAEIIEAELCDLPYDSFVIEEPYLKAYIQKEDYDARALKVVLSGLDLQTSFSANLVPWQNWNRQWESEFEPIIVGKDVTVMAWHHTREDLVLAYAAMGKPLGRTRFHIKIDPKMAFGTGTHDTTRLMVGTLLASDLKGKRVLDCGCGTGILSIAALKCGASSVVAYDIDEWSVENTQHNAQLNQVENIEVLLGDIHVLSHVSGMFDYVLANINRNILLADLPSMCEVLVPGGSLIISGFYEEDTALLVEKAEELGLTLQSSSSSGNWKMLSFCS